MNVQGGRKVCHVNVFENKDLLSPCRTVQIFNNTIPDCDHHHHRKTTLDTSECLIEWRPGDDGVELAGDAAAGDRQVDGTVAVAVGEQLIDGERGTAEEDVVALALVVEHLEGDARVRVEQAPARAGAHIVPDGRVAVRGHVRDAAGALRSVLDRHRHRRRRVGDAGRNVSTGPLRQRARGDLDIDVSLLGGRHTLTRVAHLWGSERDWLATAVIDITPCEHLHSCC